MQQTDREDAGTRPKLMQPRNVIEYALSLNISALIFSMNLPSPACLCWANLLQFYCFNTSQFSGMLPVPYKNKDHL